MNVIRKNMQAFSLIFIIPIINISYALLNNSSRGVHSLVTNLDRSIPYVKYFVIFYVIWYPFVVGALLYFCIRWRKTYYKVISSFIFGMILCYITFYFYQTTVPRPELYGTDFYTNLVRFIYSTDNPFNCFPSIHVLTSYLIIKGIRENMKKLSILSIISISTSVFIILSTQFIKQHVIMDLVFAVILSEVVYNFADIIITHFSGEEDFKSLQVGA